MRSAASPAGIANRIKGRVSAVCSAPVRPSPTPSSSTATMGAAASAICSADWAARLDQARRLKVGGRRVSSVAGIGGSLGKFQQVDLTANVGFGARETHPITDKHSDAVANELQ